MSALAVRRHAVWVSPLLAAVLLVAGTFLDPDIGADGEELAREYAENPGRIQLSALAFHFGYALLAVPAVALIGLVRARGAWIANAAAVAAVLGMTTLPGFLLIDFVDLAVYGEAGAEAWRDVTDRIEELPGATVMFLTGFVGFMLALPLALLAAWRGGFLPWWPLVVLVVGQFGGLIVPGGFGLLLWAAALVVIAYALRERLRLDGVTVAG